MKRKEEKIIARLLKQKPLNEKEKTKIVKFAHKKGVDLACITNKVASSKNLNAIETLIDLGLNTDAQLRLDFCLYKLVAENTQTIKCYDQPRNLEELIKLGANPNRLFWDGSRCGSALYKATSLENSNNVKTLLKNGADPYSTIKIIHTVVEKTCIEQATNIAIESQNYDILMPYLEAGVNFSFKPTCISLKSVTITQIFEIYNTPGKFLKLGQACSLSDELKYYKQAAMYGLQKQAKQLKKNGALSEEHLEMDKELIEKINQKILEDKKNHDILKQERLESLSNQEKLYARAIEQTKKLETSQDNSQKDAAEMTK